MKSRNMIAALVFLSSPFATPNAEAAVSVRLLEQGTESTVLEVQVDDPKLEVVDTPAGKFERFSQAELAQGGVIGESPGGAELPVIGFPLALPIDLKSADVEVIPQGDTSSMEARIYPAQPPETASSKNPELPKFEFNRDLYQRGLFRPGQSLQSKAIFKGDANVESFRFSPYGYDPLKGLLTWNRTYLIKIIHTGGRCFFVNHLASPESARLMDGIDQKIQNLPIPALSYTLNREFALKQFCPPLETPPILTGDRFIIVTHPNLLAAANTLAAHKIAQGISTLVVSTSTIAPPPFVSASATQIRNWLANYYNTHLIKPKWVLFLGDAELVPTHYDTNNAWDSAKNASDIWYGQFLAGMTAESIPPFGIGRIPVDTLAQANTVVSKVVAFETAPPANPLFGQDFYSRLTFASYFQGSGVTDQRWFAETSEIVRNYLLGLGYAVRRIYAASASSDPQFWRGGGAIPADLRKPGFAWNGTAADIAAAVNQGTALLYHRDHGWWDGWGDPSFGIPDLAAISVTNNQFPVVFSINCASGIFDGETVDLPANIVGTGYGAGVGTWWSEAFLRKPDGALAIIGDTRSSSTVDNNHLTFGLFDAVFPGLIPGYGSATPVLRLGDTLNRARAYLAGVDAGSAPNVHPLDTGGSRPGVQGLRQELNLYNLLGDPTVKLRVSPPWKFPVIDILVEKGIAHLKIPPVCLTCPPELKPEWVTAVALDPASGRIIGRGLIDDTGAGSIDLHGFQGNFVVRAASPDGAAGQAALVEEDNDGDGVFDSHDNCLRAKNPNQLDSDSDGFGNACDADFNNDRFVNSLDLALLRQKFGAREATMGVDINGDGIVNSIDLALFRQMFGAPPGPSAWIVDSAR